MKVGIDARWMIGDHRGMGRYARQLISPINRDIIAVTPSGNGTEEWRNISRGASLAPFWEQFELPSLCREHGFDLMVCPYNTGPVRQQKHTKFIAVVHDLIYLQPWRVLPPSVSHYQTLGRIYRKLVVPAFIRHVHKIVTVSEYTKSEIIERLGVPEKRIVVIPNAVGEFWFKPVVELQNRQPYFFSVAGEAPSKNVYGLLKGFSLASAKISDSSRLVVAGISPRHHAFYRRLAADFGVSDRVDFPGFLSSTELRALYRNARVFVFASLFEGFGIPLLEAMASGTPIACSNSSSMPEVAGNSALTFDPKNAEDIGEKMQCVWKVSSERSQRASIGINRARMFSESAQQTRTSHFWRSLM